MRFIRTYEIDADLDSVVHGYNLLCFEDDDCIFEKFFRDHAEAVNYGEKYLSGYFEKGFW